MRNKPWYHNKQYQTSQPWPPQHPLLNLVQLNNVLYWEAQSWLWSNTSWKEEINDFHWSPGCAYAISVQVIFFLLLGCSAGSCSIYCLPALSDPFFWPQPVSHCQKLFLGKHRKLLLNITPLWNIGTILLVHFSSLTRSLGSLPSAPFSLSPPLNLCAILLQKGWWRRLRRRRKGGFSFWTCWGMSD